MGISSGGTFILCFLLIIDSGLALQPGNRIVVTLNEYNACSVGEAVFSYDDVCANVAKCYGRRLVLNMGQCSFQTLEDASVLVKTWIDPSKIVLVEEDIAFSASQ